MEKAVKDLQSQLATQTERVENFERQIGVDIEYIDLLIKERDQLRAALIRLINTTPHYVSLEHEKAGILAKQALNQDRLGDGGKGESR